MAERITGNAGIDDRDGNPEAPGEGIGSGTTREKVHDHLPGNGLRIGRDAFGDDTVIGREDRQVAAGDFGREATAQAGDLGGQFLDTAQRAARLGLGVDRRPDFCIREHGASGHGYDPSPG